MIISADDFEMYPSIDGAVMQSEASSTSTTAASRSSVAAIRGDLRHYILSKYHHLAVISQVILAMGKHAFVYTVVSLIADD
jgi:hypothetical protein